MKRIEEFTDEELVSELMNRYDDIIIGCRKILTCGEENKTTERCRYWKGDYDACVGLMMGASMDCLQRNWKVKESDIVP